MNNEQPDDTPAARMPTEHHLVPSVTLKNYKSIAACNVQLRALTFLVGPNGAGKSNFVDALRFVTDSLRTSLDHALRDRGGINDVRRRSGGHPTHFSIRLGLNLGGESGHYGFRVGAKRDRGYEVQFEECAFGGHRYQVRSGVVTSSTFQTPPAAAADRLYLVNASGLKEFRPVYDALSSMGFYSLNPDAIRKLQAPDPGNLLLRDGSNIASVLHHLSTQSPSTKERIEQYLSKVVDGVHGVDRRVLGPMETLEFRQAVAGAPVPWRFLAANMSDGTLRALGILVAIFQAWNGLTGKVPLVAIEEPEIALHPAAAGVLRDSLHDASHTTQLIVTSHSPDLLDDPSITADSILAVANEAGATQVGPLDEASREAMKDRLYTPGELLRMNRLIPDSKTISESLNVARDPGLFDDLDE
jgi:predicted ATPase